MVKYLIFLKQIICRFDIMAMFIQSFIISILCIHRILCDACDKECSCYSWRSNLVNVSNATQVRTQEYDRFSVNCTGTHLENTANGLEYVFSRKERYIPSLPLNITDLLVTGYHLDMLKDLFTYLRKLTSISVANNHIYKVEKGSFRKVNQVKMVNISHNFLKQIEPGIFCEVQILEVLDLSYNMLETLQIEPGTFCEVQSLKVLDLSYNMLRTLPWKNISQLSSLKVLGLKGNFWNCS